MSILLPIVYIASHGETWIITGQLTGLTDLPLAAQAEMNARGLQKRLKGLQFAKIFTNPLKRARQTCALTRFAPVPEVDHDLVRQIPI